MQSRSDAQIQDQTHANTQTPKYTHKQREREVMSIWTKGISQPHVISETTRQNKKTAEINRKSTNDGWHKGRLEPLGQQVIPVQSLKDKNIQHSKE